MLTGVLLHMIETPRPVNRSMDRAIGAGAVRHVDDAVALVHDLQDVCFTEPSDVVGLAARGRIKRRPVQRHTPRAAGWLRLWRGFAANDLCFEFLQKRIVVVEPLGGHRLTRRARLATPQDTCSRSPC